MRLLVEQSFKATKPGVNVFKPCVHGLKAFIHLVAQSREVFGGMLETLGDDPSEFFQCHLPWHDRIITNCVYKSSALSNNSLAVSYILSNPPGGGNAAGG